MSDADRLNIAAEQHHAHVDALIATAERLAAENERLRIAIHKALVALRCPNGGKAGLAAFILTKTVVEAGE